MVQGKSIPRSLFTPSGRVESIHQCRQLALGISLLSLFNVKIQISMTGKLLEVGT